MTMNAESEGAEITAKNGACSCGCNGTCGCNGEASYVYAIAPPAGCHYEGQLTTGPCDKVTCGRVVCGSPPPPPPAECSPGDDRYERCSISGRPGFRYVRCVNGHWQSSACHAGAIP